MSGKQPAFPCEHFVDGSGMTYRQWMVGMALQGILADHKDVECVLGKTCEQSVGIRAVEAADAAIKAEQESR